MSWKSTFESRTLCFYHVHSTVLSLNMSSSPESQILTIINQRHLEALPSKISTVSGNYVISRFATMAIADKSIVIKRNVPDQSLLVRPSLMYVKQSLCSPFFWGGGKEHNCSFLPLLSDSSS